MGLDVYVGPLQRYYSREWKTIIQQQAEADGAEAQIQFDSEHQILPTDIVAEAVELWIASIENWLQKDRRKWKRYLKWKEGLDLEYWTDKPDWAGYDGLRNWAAFALFGDHEANKDLTEFDGASDAIDRALGHMLDTDKFEEFWHLIAFRDVWFPGNHIGTYATPGLNGREICLGWQGPFFDALVSCNEMTWNASVEQILEWGKEAKSYDDGLEACAKFGFSLFYQAAVKAKKMKQPILIDY